MLSFKQFKDLPCTAKYDIYTELFTSLELLQERNNLMSENLDYFINRYTSLEKKYYDYCELVRKLF